MSKIFHSKTLLFPKMDMLTYILLLALQVGLSLEKCGQTPIEPSESKIVGGQKALPYSWPWQIALCRKSGFWFKSCSVICGGSVISNQWIMTAGHCVHGYTDEPNKFKIKIGVYRVRKNNEDGELVSTISEIHLHPKYDHHRTVYDIALLKLTEPIEYTDHIQPVCIPENDDKTLTDDNTVTVTGWGYTEEGDGKLSNELRQVDVPVVSTSKCDDAYDGKIDSDVMFCAGLPGKDSCQGDSGGPVVVQDASGTWHQYGIVSWGYGCAEEGYPGVYSRVTAYKDWIREISSVSAN